MDPVAAAVAALMAAHTDAKAAPLLGALKQFRAEMTCAYVIAAEADEGTRLDALLAVAHRLADEEGSPTVPGWEAWLTAVAGLRADLPDGASELVTEIEEYLDGEA